MYISTAELNHATYVCPSYRVYLTVCGEGAIA